MTPDGLSTSRTMCSPLAITTTSSCANFPSEPGAPFGQSRMDCALAAVGCAADARTIKNTIARRTVRSASRVIDALECGERHPSLREEGHVVHRRTEGVARKPRRLPRKEARTPSARGGSDGGDEPREELLLTSEGVRRHAGGWY